MPAFNLGPTVVGLGPENSLFPNLLDCSPDPFFPERDHAPPKKLAFLKVTEPPRQDSNNLPEKMAKLNLDLTRISNRILVMGRCWNYRTDREANRNNLEESACFLNARYEKSYLIFNMSSTDLKYDLSPFKNQVVSFPISKVLTPTIRTLFDACRCMSAWLRLDPENVVIVQCRNGKARSGLLIACFLRYCGLFDTAYEALEFFVTKRCPQGDSSWITNTLKRYLRYFNDILILEGRIPSSIPLRLHQVIMTTIPNFDGHGSCDPGIEVYQEGSLIYSSLISQAQVKGGDGFKEEDEVDAELLRQLKISMALNPDKFKQNYNPLIMMDNFNIIFRLENISISHDVQIRVYHHNSQASQNVTIFNLAFNTAFMSPGLIRLRKTDLETPNDPAGTRVNPEFSVDLVLIPCEDYSRQERVSYETCCERSFIKDLTKLSQFHPVRADPLLTKPLELQEHKKFFVKLALQLGNNDIHSAHEFLSYLSKTPFYSQLEKEIQEVSREKHESLVTKPVKTVPKQSAADQEHKKVAEEYPKTDTPPSGGLPFLASILKLKPRDEDDSNSINPQTEAKVKPTPGGLPFLASIKKLKPKEDEESSAGPAAPQGLPFLASIKKLRPNDNVEEDKSECSTESSHLVHLPINLNAPTPPPLPDFLKYPNGSAPGPPPPLPAFLRSISELSLSSSKSSNQSASHPPKLPSSSSVLGLEEECGKSQKIKNSLHWSEIKDKMRIENTIWSELDVLQQFQSFDVHRFEELFCIDPIEDAKNKTLSRSRSFEDSGRKLPRILDSRRANNVGIGLSRFYKRMSTSEIIEAVIGRKFDIIDINDLLCLKAIVPTDEERERFGLFNGDASVLIPSEQFMYHVSRVPQFTWMVNALIFEAQFPSECESINNKLTVLCALLTKIRESPGLKTLFTLVLQLGNLANYDYGRVPAHMRIRGKALGFTMDSLLKLHEVKSVDRKATLLNYLAIMVAEKHDNLLTIPDDFNEMGIVKHWDTDAIYSDIAQLSLHFNKFNNLRLESEETAQLKTFRESQSVFLNMAKIKLEKLSKLAAAAKQSWKETATYLSEDPTDKKPEELLMVFDQFFKQFKEAHTQNLKLQKASSSSRDSLRSTRSSTPNVSVPSRSGNSSPLQSEICTVTTIDSLLEP